MRSAVFRPIPSIFFAAFASWKPNCYGEYPVSYTHLDVYKRQLRDIMAFLVLEVLAGLEIDGVSQIFTIFKNVADGGRTPAVHLSLIHI